MVSASKDPEVRAVQAETALEALKIKFQGATKEYEEVKLRLNATLAVAELVMIVIISSCR